MFYLQRQANKLLNETNEVGRYIKHLYIIKAI